MQIVFNFIRSVFLKPSFYLFIFILIFSVDRFKRWSDFENGNFPMVYDVDQYYSYLPAYFVHHDLSFSFQHNYWTSNLPNGKHIPKVTMGMALLYSPFFLTAHAIAKNSNYKADGYSLPYKMAMHIGSILFSMVGLWFCRKNLLRFFNEYITAISLICIYFGTNLFYYTYGLGEMPHAYLFFLFSLFIHFCFKWLEEKKTRSLYLLAFLAGYAVLIRPTEIIILLFPLLIFVNNAADLKERLRMVFSYRLKLMFALFLFLLPFFVQMIYWKIHAGSWFFYSYGEDEKFFFKDPQLFNFLFSFRKGWFLYTPMILLALFGIPLMKGKVKGMRSFMLLLLLITIYLLSSWWDWAYGGSFGCRAMIQYYAFLLFPLASFFNFMNEIFKEKFIRVTSQIIIGVALVFMIDLNLDQSWLYKYGIIASDGMTKEAYLLTIGKTEFNSEEVKNIQNYIIPPDREAMKKGKRD